MPRFAEFVAMRYADPLAILAEHIDDAIAAAATIGAKLDGFPTLDGARHYLPNQSGKKERRHYYRASVETDADGTVWPCITFGTFKGGSSTFLWKPRNIVWREFEGANNKATAADPERIAAFQRRAAELLADQERRNIERLEQERLGEQAAADAAACAWAAAEPCTAHPYLAAKDVSAYGLRVAATRHSARLYSKDDGVWRTVKVASAGDLLVPMVDAAGTLWSLQRIDAAGAKLFITGSRKRGLFHRIEGAGRAWLAEGYATAASVHAATGDAAVVAFDAGNLGAVAEALAGQVHAVAADNDESDAGRKGADATGLPCALPPAVGDDWNDHAARHGLNSVASLLSDLLLQPPEAVPTDHARAVALDVPLRNLETIFHPEQIVWKKNKDTGEHVFSGALGTAENLSRLVAAYGVRVRYNELSRDVEISVGGVLPEGDLARNARLSGIEDLCRINRYPYTSAAGHLDNLASRDAYNPALEWVRSCAWDGGPHIGALFDCLTLADQSKADISRTLFRKWILGAVAILSGHTRKFEHVLVLVDPDGGIGKTRFFNTLCPGAFQADGVTLKTDDKDSILQVVSKWLVELGEIGATFSRSDIESLKAFLSRDTDELRPAYARASNCYQRRTAFFGSVNNVQFLVDDTNNRRFWPIQVAAVNYRHKVDVQQVWAEAMACVEAGEAWHLDVEENRQIGEYNEGFRSKGRVEEFILDLYDQSAIFSRYLSASQVLDEIGMRNPTQTDTRKASAMLRKLFPCKVRRGLTVFHLPYLREDRRPISLVRERYEVDSGPL